MTQPKALQLADRLSGHGGLTFVEMHAAASELRRLHAENFALSAGQCVHAAGDEGGTPICAEVTRLQAARARDNVAFKQLLAQRDALLEALKTMLAAGHGTSGRLIVGAADEAAARAAIKTVEHGK